jgi:aspartyl-tRNA(Asn)/glutamyl-tRNA(Gln) amidotransferase subunit C
MKLTTKEVEHIAKLTRISLSEEEKEYYANQLGIVFEYMKNLDKVDITGVEETCQVTGLEDVVREDIVEKDEHIGQKIRDLFPSKKDDYLVVSEVFKTEKK